MAALFDLEGTLVETIYQRDTEMVKRFHNQTKNILIKAKIPSNIISSYNKSSLMRNATFEWAKKNLTKKEYDNIINIIEKFLDTYDTESAKTSTIYPETKFILNTLQSNSIEMGIVTNTSKKACDYILEKFDLSKYFLIKISRNDVIKIKPDPEMIFLAISKMKKKPNWLVGDSIIDSQAAFSANISSIIIKRNGVQPNYYCDHCVSTLVKVPSIILKNQPKQTKL
jgi:HAD superfamily hydrolase (TIGR01549 family)